MGKDEYHCNAGKIVICPEAGGEHCLGRDEGSRQL